MELSGVQLIAIFIVSAIAGMGSVLDEFQTHRPLIACTLVGAILGDITTGIIIGGTLEMIALGWMNIGAAMAPDAALASVRTVGHANHHHGNTRIEVIGPVLNGEPCVRRGNEGIVESTLDVEEHASALCRIGVVGENVDGHALHEVFVVASQEFIVFVVVEVLFRIDLLERGGFAFTDHVLRGGVDLDRESAAAAAGTCLRDRGVDILFVLLLDVMTSACVEKLVIQVHVLVDLRGYGLRQGKQGGGTLFFPAGRYLTGPIHLKSNITLELEAGATLLFSTNFDDYLPFVEVRHEGVMMKSFSPLIYAVDAENITIKGEGTLDGQGKARYICMFQSQ